MAPQKEVRPNTAMSEAQITQKHRFKSSTKSDAKDACSTSICGPYGIRMQYPLTCAAPFSYP